MRHGTSRVGLLRIRTAKRLAVAAAGLLASAAPAAVWAADARTMGWVEKISLEPWGHLVKAKLDTGALTSSIHAEDVERFERDGEVWVRFDIEVETVDDGVRREEVERRLVRDVRIERKGQDDRRAVVEMTFCLDEDRHRAEFTLNDRDGFLYSVLLGRRFLEDVALVDPGREFLTEPRCDGPDDDDRSDD